MPEAKTAVLERPDQKPVEGIKLFENPEYAPLADTSVRGFDIPKTPAQFRQSLALPDRLQFSPEEDFEQKRETVEGYTSQQVAAIPHSRFHREEVNLNLEDSKIQSQITDQSLSTRLWRAYTKKRLNMAGIKNAREVLKDIEENVYIRSKKDLKPATVARLIKNLDPQNESTALNKFDLALRRARQFYLLPVSSDFKDSPDELIDFMSVLANIPEPKWQEIYHQFDGSTQVIYYLSGFFGLHQQEGLLQIIKQGGLTVKQQQTLKRAVVWTQFSDALPFLTEPAEDRSYEFWLKYSELLDPAVGQQIDKYYPYLIDWAAGQVAAMKRPPRVGQQEMCDGRDFTVGLQKLESTGKLAYLNTLIKAGWNCQGIYQTMDGLAYFPKAGQWEKLEQTLTQAVAFQSDPEKVDWTLALRKYYYDQDTLYARGVPFYEEMLKNKETLVTIALILNSLPKRGNFHPADFLIFKDGEVGINRHKLGSYLEQLKFNADLSEVEKRYVRGLSYLLFKPRQPSREALPEFLPVHELPLLLYLAQQGDRVVSQIFDREGNFLSPEAAIINELFSQRVTVDKQLMSFLITRCGNQNELLPDLQVSYFDFLSIEDRAKVLANLPEDILVTQLRISKSTVVLFRQLSPALQSMVAAGGQEAISSFIDNGYPTISFAETALTRGIFQKARQFFTEEVLVTFPLQKQQFIKAMLSLPAEIIPLFSGRRSAEWDYFFEEGKPTPALLKMVAANGRMREIDTLFGVIDLSHFSAEDQAFWNFYKSIPRNPNMRAFLLKMPDRFSQMVVNGQPTAAFLENVAQAIEISTIREVLSFINISELPAQQRAFWEFYPTIDQGATSVIRDHLLKNRERFAEFIENDKPSLAFLDHAVSVTDPNLIKQILDKIDWDKMPATEKNFWQYYLNSPLGFIDFLLKNKDQFSRMVFEGQETPVFYRALIDQQPRMMFELPHLKPGLSAKQYQDFWRMALGKEIIDKFLTALPKATDEARNAFTGNDYDRTSEFIRYLKVRYLKARMPQDQFTLNAAEFSTMTAYVNQFGLARNETMYRYFRFLHLFEHQQITALPEEMKILGITSTAEMIQRISEVSRLVFGEKQLLDVTELRNLTPFQRQLLANVTGYDSARFGRGSTDNLGWLISQFAADLEQGDIPALSIGYEAETIEALSVKVEFNEGAIKGDYEVLKGEILECIDHPPTVDSLKSTVKGVVERRIGKINETLVRITNDKAKAAISRDLTNFQTYLSQVDEVSDIDNLTLSLLGMNFPSEDRSGIDSVVRKIILAKLYQRHARSPGFLENTRIKLVKDEITAEGIDEIILTIDEMVKNHVLNLDRGNQEGYWQPQVFDAIFKGEPLRKVFRRLTERFNPHADKLRQEQARFIKHQTGVVSEVQIIPDRGLIGEMAGYLADVCYVKVQDLLKTYSGKTPEQPLVVPYKFVINDPGASEPRFIGSVLVFEVQTAKGEPALLIRALDIPNEGEIDISKFIENLLDKFAEVGLKRGKKKVLVAGTGGTISNYSSITAHVIDKYVRGKSPEPVSPKFDFNGYDITNTIFTARTIMLK